MNLRYTLLLASVLLTANCMPMKDLQDMDSADDVLQMVKSLSIDKEESEYDIRPEELDESGALMESDIKLTPEQQLILDARIQQAQTGKTGRKGTANIAARWTGDVPYTLNSALSSQAREGILAAIQHWEDNTCIRFQQLSGSIPSDLRYIEFVSEGGCWSYIGKLSNSGPQQISIGQGCERMGTVAHEIGHAMGFFHEQSRPERDDYVEILFGNIQSGKEGNFQKYGHDEVVSHGVPYDLTSIMHYGGSYFSANGELTIRTRDPEKQGLIGKRERLSFYDIKLANEMYNCGANCNVQLACESGGYVGPQCTCACPVGLTGDTCGSVDTSSGCGGVLQGDRGTFTSPNFPSNYDDNTQCDWLIKGERGSTVQLEFEEFGLEAHDSCAFDSVEVRLEGPQVGGRRFCGSGPGAVGLESATETLFVRFRSDQSQTGKGFKAKYTILGGSGAGPATTAKPAGPVTTEESKVPTTTTRQPERPTTTRQPERPTTTRQPERPTTTRQPERPSTTQAAVSIGCTVGTGESYRGRLAKTASGRTCQRWDAQTPHQHSRTPANYPNFGLEENFCRNPDGEPSPWCYTTDQSVRWELCEIPTCTTTPPAPPAVTTRTTTLAPAVPTTKPEGNCAEECAAGTGASYRGTVFVTATGRTCQRWDAQAPHQHDRTPTNYQDSGLEENYCRNPDGEASPWCYTTDRFVRWEHCSIPACNTPTEGANRDTCYEGNGAAYNGVVAVTDRGLTCQHWNAQSPHSHSFHGQEENYCRNPDGGTQPWCYTTDSSVRWQYCSVPKCEG
ncbi:protein SpAN-like isoform X1 [Branchiostoma floridae]|uniref:Metalloendopeptidase n=1 Tax=Branchiostoma floridae TaxID=7739 RepID=A0A9J7HT19_BRAFL|nr:protein SpAN-like isoform X1 [Branchiostoma floridae]